jgi:hypothetical protein
MDPSDRSWRSPDGHSSCMSAAGLAVPATVVSTTLKEPLDWPNATVVSGDAVDVVARLKEESNVPLRSYGSLSLNRALMAAGTRPRIGRTRYQKLAQRRHSSRDLRRRSDRETASSR